MKPKWQSNSHTSIAITETQMIAQSAIENIEISQQSKGSIFSFEIESVQGPGNCLSKSLYLRLLFLRGWRQRWYHWGFDALYKSGKSGKLGIQY